MEPELPNVPFFSFNRPLILLQLPDSKKEGEKQIQMRNKKSWFTDSPAVKLVMSDCVGS